MSVPLNLTQIIPFFKKYCCCCSEEEKDTSDDDQVYIKTIALCCVRADNIELRDDINIPKHLSAVDEVDETTEQEEDGKEEIKF